MITVEGKKYKVTENIGYSHDAGLFFKAVATEQGERIVVKINKKWYFHTAIASIRLIVTRDQENIYNEQENKLCTT